MKHTPHTEHMREDEGSPVSLVRRSVSTLVSGVMSGTEVAVEAGGTIVGRTLRVAGKGVRGFMRGLFPRS